MGMVELQGIHNTSGEVSWGPGNYTVRELILLQKTYEGNQIGNQKVGVRFLTRYPCTEIQKGGWGICVIPWCMVT